MVNRLNDMLVRILNSQKRGRLEVIVLRSRLCGYILDCLLEEGYIRGYVIEDKKHFKVLLKYYNGEPVIRVLKSISKPGLRVYYSGQELRQQFLKNKKIIFTSSLGVFCNSALLHKEGLQRVVGGEALIEIN